VAALPEIVECLTGSMRLVDSDGFDHNADAANERIALPENVGSELALDDDREFEEISGGDAAARRVADGVDVAFVIRFFREDSY
jgi:hypothetical protein